jgi:hypothetical protein
MTRPFAALMLASAALAGLLATHAPAQDPDLAQKLARLEVSQAELDRRLATLATEVQKNTDALAAVQGYLQAQASAADAMRATLAASEEAGFTFGINPESRHILLDGWRRQLAATEKDVPGAPAPQAGEGAAATGRSRR